MITVFTTTTCAYCVMVKSYLTKKGKEFNVVNLDDNPEMRETLREKTGASTVPIIQAGEEYIIGWNPAKLGAL